MSEARLKAPRGTFDVLGADAAARARLESVARRLLEQAGYSRIETPCFEASELFERTVGEATDIVQKEMYTFRDGSGRSLTLRPEGTAPVCRAYVEHGMHKRPQPVKLWYLSSFFRYERSQKGRYRQFFQVGAEALGSDDPALDAESITLLWRLVRQVGGRDVRLRLSSLGSPTARRAYREQLKEHLRAHEEQLSEEVRSRIELNPLRAFDSEHEGTRSAMRGAPVLLDHISEQDVEHFEEVKGLLDAAGVPYEVDPTLVRGLDYYTRTVFELTSEALGAQSGVGGGGRYDGLVQQLGGQATPGVGWAAGVERILLAADMSAPSEPPLDAYICLQLDRAAEGVRDGAAAELRRRAFTLLQRARSAGIAVDMEMAGRSLKGQRAQAARRGASLIVTVSEQATTLRDVECGEEQCLDDGELLHELVRRSSRRGTE